jgi:hypothetical protein
MSRFGILSALLVVAVPAFAQRPPPQDKAAVTFEEVERGFFFGVEAGVSAITNPPAEEGRLRPFSWGQMAMVEVGYELFERVSLAAFVMASSHSASSQYTGFSPNQGASGDFATLVPGLTARVSIIGFADAQAVDRTFVYARAGVGYANFWPKALLPETDVLVFGGPGVEYFTRLRHFSVGLEVMGSYLVTGQAMGFTITPNLRYAF